PRRGRRTSRSSSSSGESADPIARVLTNTFAFPLPSRTPRLGTRNRSRAGGDKRTEGRGPERWPALTSPGRIGPGRDRRPGQGRGLLARREEAANSCTNFCTGRRQNYVEATSAIVAEH